LHTTTKPAPQHIRDKARLLLEADTENIGQRTRRPQREKSRTSSQSNEPKPHAPARQPINTVQRGVDRCGINTLSVLLSIADEALALRRGSRSASG
jgi:hypothetical protein